MNMKIAVIITCFNRKDKTLACLKGLYESQKEFNDTSKERVEIEVFLTDDGCTDGTSNAIRNYFADYKINILSGSGNLFWAGGMRLAWKEALKRHDEWDYYLLLNDDTTIDAQCINELMSSEAYSINEYKKKAIVSGITCSEDNPSIITYGGDIIQNKITGKLVRLGRSSKPQIVDLTNANILLVPKEVVDKIGIFYEGFKHGRADNDYSMLARRKGIPVLITPNVCGICDNDHKDTIKVHNKIINMSQKERTAYFNHPLHSNSDYLLLIRRNMPLRYPVAWIFRMLNTYCPKIYYRINRIR